MKHLHTIIKEEVKKLYDAIIEAIDNEEDAEVIQGYIHRSMELIILYDGGYTLDGFFDTIHILEEREYYNNVLKDEEYEVRDS